LPYDQKEHIFGIPEKQPSPAGSPEIRAAKKYYMSHLNVIF